MPVLDVFYGSNSLFTLTNIHPDVFLSVVKMPCTLFFMYIGNGQVFGSSKVKTTVKKSSRKPAARLARETPATIRQ